MKSIETKEAYEVLCENIWRHNRLYFQEANPEIEDEEFDDLVRLLEKTERLHPEWISPTSPTQRIGEEVLTGFAEVRHKEVMLSLEKAYERKELEAFYERVSKLTGKTDPEFNAELKMDGLAISITYENGKLIQALTRGDGVFGSDITQNCKTIKDIPLRIDPSIRFLEVRGEIFIPKKQFLALNANREKEGLPLWANPRNAAAGSIKLLDAKKIALREGLSCVIYGIARQDPEKIFLQSDVFPFVRSLGLQSYLTMKNLPFVPLRKISSVEQMLQFADEIAAVRDKLPFHIDGVVFKLNDLELTKNIPPTLKHPRTAIAWKFSSEKVWTHLLDITCGVGRTGVVTPIAILEPVEVMGSTIAKATLHNADEIARKDIRIGDRVLIEKGGDVIPKVVESDPSQLHRNQPYVMPKNCPSCGSLLLQDTDGVAYRCCNHKNCPEQSIRRLIHFASKEGLDMEHLGESSIRALYEKGFVRNVCDFFTLTKEQLCLLEGIQEKSAKNILQGILDAKQPELSSLIMALGIRHVGKGTALRLAHVAKTILHLLELSTEDLQSIEGIGEEVALSIYETIRDPFFVETIIRLLEVGVTPRQKELAPSAEESLFYKKQVVFTGSLSIPRSEAIQIVEQLGGTVTDSVSKKTNIVVVGIDPGSKAEKAKKLHVQILDENSFIQEIKKFI